MKTTNAPTRIALALGLTLASGAALAQAGPQEVLLAGSVRDFRSSHPDFGLSGLAAGPTTGLVEYSGTSGHPRHRGVDGTELTQHALDAASFEIAPHLYGAGPQDTAVFILEGGMEVANKATIDLYDPAVGYDPASADSMPVLDNPPPLESLTPPAMSVPKVGSIERGNDFEGGFSTLTAGEYWCDAFWLGNQHTLTIEGDVVLRADDSFAIRNHSTLLLAPGATLTIWTGGSLSLENNTSVGMNLNDHTRITINHYGTEDVLFENTTEFQGTLHAPDATVTVTNTAQFYGAMTAADLTIDNTAGVHIAGDFTFLDECFAAGDTQPAAGLPDTGQILSPASFDQWFRDVPGVNVGESYQLMLKKVGSEYVASFDGWDPIGDDLYGNESASQNYGYTMDLQGLFLNTNCGGMYIEIETGMDCWLFIDDVLAIDLGGISGNTHQRIELDRLGLASDTWHRVRLYVAQRLNSPQDFTLRTSLPLTPPRQVTVRNSNMYD